MIQAVGKVIFVFAVGKQFTFFNSERGKVTEESL